jgi:hypothetical protein
MKSFVFLATIATLAAIPAQAQSKNLCTVAPGKKWIPMAAAKKVVAAAGYTKIRMGLEAGCYEGEAQKGGVQYEVFVHPQTGKIVKVRKDAD